MSTLVTNTLSSPGGTGTITVPTGQVLYAPGSVIQTQQTVYRDTFSSSAGTGWAAVSGLNCTITPSKISSRILVMLDLNYGQQYYQLKVRLTRDGSVVTGALGTLAGLRPQSWLTLMAYDNAVSDTIYNLRSATGVYLDSPESTSALTYGIDIGGYSPSFAVYVNRNHNFTNSAANDATPLSTMTLWEVAG